MTSTFRHIAFSALFLLLLLAPMLSADPAPDDRYIIIGFRICLDFE